MKRRGILLLSGVAMMSWPLAACAESVELPTQSLPKATIEASVSEVLLACPNDAQLSPEGQPLVRTTAAIDTSYVADVRRTYAISAKGGGWTGVSFDLEFYPDGRLQKVNATTEGAGGAAVAGLLKAVAGVAAVLVGDETLPRPKCREDILKLTREAASLRNEIADLEFKAATAAAPAAAAAGGKPADAADKAPSTGARLATLKELLTRKEAQLTLKTNLDLEPVTSASETQWLKWSGGSSAYQKWFDLKSGEEANWPTALKPYKLKGKNGFALQVTSDAPLKLAVGAKNTPLENQIAYVQPPKATAAVCSFDTAKGECAGAITGASIYLPQAAEAKFLVIKGTVFGSRSLSAAFSEYGAPTSVSYKTKAQIDQIAAALAGAGDAATTLRGASTSQVQRDVAEEKARIELIELRKKRADLEAP